MLVLCSSYELSIGTLHYAIDTGLDGSWLERHFTPHLTHWAAWLHGLK